MNYDHLKCSYPERFVIKSRKENPQKPTQLSSRSHPRHLVAHYRDNGSFRSYSRSDPGSFRSDSLSVRSFRSGSFRSDFRGELFRRSFGGSFRPTLFLFSFCGIKTFSG